MAYEAIVSHNGLVFVVVGLVRYPWTGRDDVLEKISFLLSSMSLRLVENRCRSGTFASNSDSTFVAVKFTDVTLYPFQGKAHVK